MSARKDEASGSPNADEGKSPGAETGLSLDELEAEGGAPLPDREAMSLISANVDIPANPAIAADVLAGDLEGFDSEEGGPHDEES
jgi:hypothetical protein